MKVGITGVTGFVGSGIACDFLKKGHKVVAVSRNDKDGVRTKAAIKKAWLGYGYDLAELNEQSIEVLSIDFSKPEEIDESVAKTLDIFWHVAAEMSYSSRSFIKSFQQNITNTAALHRYLAKTASNLKRFYYVSTAYTGGFANEGLIKEEIHVAPQVDNVYQALKWAAELTLERQSQDYDLPVSLFRPSIVVGHSDTGYRASSNFGIYGFIKASYIAARYNYKTLRFNLIENAEANLIPVNYLSEWAVLLSEREDQSSTLEIYNASAASVVKISEMAELAKGLLDVDILIEKPQTDIDRRINKMTQRNAPFAKKSWYFESNNLKKALGSNYREFVMSDKSLRVIVERYLEDLDLEFEKENKRYSLKEAIRRASGSLKSIGSKIKGKRPDGVMTKIEVNQTKHVVRKK